VGWVLTPGIEPGAARWNDPPSTTGPPTPAGGNLDSSHELTHSYQLLANVNYFLVKHVVNTTKSVFLSTTLIAVNEQAPGSCC